MEKRRGGPAQQQAQSPEDDEDDAIDRAAVMEILSPPTLRAVAPTVPAVEPGRKGHQPLQFKPKSGGALLMRRTPSLLQRTLQHYRSSDKLQQVRLWGGSGHGARSALLPKQCSVRITPIVRAMLSPLRTTTQLVPPTPSSAVGAGPAEGAVGGDPATSTAVVPPPGSILPGPRPDGAPSPVCTHRRVPQRRARRAALMRGRVMERGGREEGWKRR